MQTGKTVRICDFRSQQVQVLNNTNETTTAGEGEGTLFRVVQPAKYKGTDIFSFRTDNGRYLTMHMYNDLARNEVATALGRAIGRKISCPFIIHDIAAFAVPSAENPTFEGGGFDYTPMTAEMEQYPLFNQLFAIENCGYGRKYGIKSLFNTYWRSQWWTNHISQSPHCLGDEQWTFDEVTEGAEQKRTRILRFVTPF